MKLQGKLLAGVFRARPNRFLALIDIEKGITIPCFVPNPGRMHELLIPGVEVMLNEAQNLQNRKTRYDLFGVHYGDQIVSIDSRIPNKLVHEALLKEELEEFMGYDTIRTECRYGDSRIDFCLFAKNRNPCLLEIKSCTLVKGDRALFPDAPTERGRRHMMELAEAKQKGYRTCVLFIVQRTDTRIFSPNDETDPKFGEALRAAAANGVEIYSYFSIYQEDEVTLGGKLLVDLRRN
ncbi:MAG: DNA/RNA nuclease SfsA [Candidatus Heimdallarchaeota archaeon]